tara:strand:- start:442 stop:837 length:396 start_codon:yes stop_codon:yes gene_type:complete
MTQHEGRSKQARRLGRVGKTARKTYRRLKTDSYDGQHKEFPKKMKLTVTITDGDKPAPLCEQREYKMRLTHITKHRFTDSTVRAKAHYINVVEVEDEEGNTSKVDGDYTYTTYEVSDKHFPEYETTQAKEE